MTEWNLAIVQYIFWSKVILSTDLNVISWKKHYLNIFELNIDNAKQKEEELGKKYITYICL